MPFRVIDVFYDYGSEKGFIVVDRSILLKYLPDRGAVEPRRLRGSHGAISTTVKAEVEQAVAAPQHPDLHQSRAAQGGAADLRSHLRHHLRAGGRGCHRRGHGHRRRPAGAGHRPPARVRLLRFLGADIPQIRKLILFEAGLLGLLANIAGLALGVVLSLLLIFVINKQSFGWTIQFHWPVAVLLGALTVVYAATVLAGLYPARVATRLNPDRGGA